MFEHLTFHGIQLLLFQYTHMFFELIFVYEKSQLVNYQLALNFFL